MSRFLVVLIILILSIPVFKPELLGKSEAQRAFLDGLNPDELVKGNGERELAGEEWKDTWTLSITILHSNDPSDRNEFFRRIDWKGEPRWLNVEQYAHYQTLNAFSRFAYMVCMICISFLVIIAHEKLCNPYVPKVTPKRILSESERKLLAKERITRHRHRYKKRRREKSGGRR